MRSAVAEQVREADRQDILRLSLRERLELARELEEDGISLLMSTQQIDREEALRRVERSRKSGRRHSVLNEE